MEELEPGQEAPGEEAPAEEAPAEEEPSPASVETFPRRGNTLGEEGAGTGTGSGAESPTVPNATVVHGRFVLETAVPAGPAGQKTGMLACGPEAMMIEVEAFANLRQGEGEEVYFHRETFDF